MAWEGGKDSSPYIPTHPHTLTLQVNGGGACKLLGPFDGFEKESAEASLADPQTQVLW